MNNPTRRSFLGKSTLLTLGALAGNCEAFGESEAEHTLKGVDRELANVLRSYGRTDVMIEAGFQNVKVGKKMRRLPSIRLEVKVGDEAAFQSSFEKLTRLSDRVMVKGNTARFARNDHYFVLENRLG